MSRMAETTFLVPYILRISASCFLCSLLIMIILHFFWGRQTVTDAIAPKRVDSSTGTGHSFRFESRAGWGLIVTIGTIYVIESTSCHLFSLSRFIYYTGSRGIVHSDFRYILLSNRRIGRSFPFSNDGCEDRFGQVVLVCSRDRVHHPLRETMFVCEHGWLCRPPWFFRVVGVYQTLSSHFINS